MNTESLLNEFITELYDEHNGDVELYRKHLIMEREQIDRANEQFSDCQFKPFPVKYIEAKEKLLDIAEVIG